MRRQRKRTKSAANAVWPNAVWPSAMQLVRLVGFAGLLSIPCAAAVLGAAQSAESDAAALQLPLEKADDGLRSFELTTSEVTWLSVDVAPDGETLVIDVLGDLFTLPVAGGAASSLTTGMAFDSQPAFSPDGSHVAFVSDRDGADNVWILPLEGGDPVQLSRDKTSDFASPTWSADGEYVIVSRIAKGARTYELWMYHRDGGAGVQITKAKASPQVPPNRHHNAMGAVASPDGRFLYYARRNGGFEYNASFPMWQIARRDLRTGEEDVITNAPGSAVRPVLSPDGKTLIYATRRDNETALRTLELETGEERWLRYPVQRDEQESTFTRDLFPGYAFVPDGSALIVTWDGGLHRVELSDGSASEVEFAVELDLQIGPSLDAPRRVETGPVRARVLQGAERSPNGEVIVVSALGRVYAQDSPGDQPRLLSAEDQRAYQPTFSPDGGSVVYVTWSREGGHLWSVPTTGGAPRQLTSRAAYYSEPSVSKDGERVVALRGALSARVEMPAEFGGSPLALDLVWVPATGGDVALIAPSRGLARPHFGPEDDRLYVTSSAGLQSMRWDGTDQRTHLQVVGPGLYFAAEPVPANELRISPDGRWALARVSNQFYLVAVPVVGGEAPKVNVASPSVPVRKLTPLGADGVAWNDGGDTITWSLGSSVWSIARDAVDFPRAPAGAAAAAGADEEEDSSDADEAADEEESDKPSSYPEADERQIVVEIPRSVPRGVVALRGARVITMNDTMNDESGADGGVIERGDVVVRDNRIVAVGASGSVDIPRGATEIDVTGKTIVPGFVDTHAHWIEIRRGVLDPDSWPFFANLAWGVTTGLDVQTMTNDMFAYQDMIDAGELIGPRAFSTGPGVFSNNDFKSREDVEGVLERYRDYYRTRNIKAYLSGNRKQRQWIAQVSKELGIMPTTEGGLDLKLDLTHGLDGFAGNEHSLPVVPLFDDVAQLYAQAGTAYTPTLLVAYGGPWAENHYYTTEVVHERDKLKRFVPPGTIDGVTRKRSWFREDEHVFSRLAESAAKIMRAGGRVGVGAHGQLQGLGYHWELWALHSGGFTEVEALRAATIMGAEIIGVGQDLGSLEEGKLADLVVLDANPLDDIRNTDTVRYVMKNGEIFEGETLDRIWPSRVEFPDLWWWEEEERLDAMLSRSRR